MSATVLAFKQKKETAKLWCSSCGAKANAVCDCNVGYMAAGEYAEKIVAENPDKGNRAIADEFGISESSVRLARKNSGAQNNAPEKRVGKDGKKYPAKRKQKERRKPRRKHPIEIETNFDELEDTYEALLGLFKKIVKRFRYMPNDVIEEALDHALRRHPRRNKS